MRARRASRVGFVFLWLFLGIAVGGITYFAITGFVGLARTRAEASNQALTTEPQPSPPVEEPVEEPAETKESESKRQAEEAARQEEERLRQEAQRKKQEEDEILAQKKEAERRVEQAREEQRRKEEQTKREAERLLAQKKNSPVAASLEEIETFPDKYFGQFVSAERVVIKLSAIDYSKELKRITIGVTSEQGKYYSRAPLSGLLVSTSEKLGGLLQKHIDGTDDYYRFKLYCEIRKWQKKGDTSRSYPEAFVYRVEAYDRMGKLTKMLEE